MKPATVPCGSCRLCCRNFTLVVLTGDDDPAAFDTQLVHGAPALKHRSNGDCVYLAPEGCTIHDRAPIMCRAYDCRSQFAMYDRATRRDMVRRGLLDAAILARGRELLGR